MQERIVPEVDVTYYTTTPTVVTNTTGEQRIVHRVASTNPAGRPFKGTSISEHLREFLTRPAPDADGNELPHSNAAAIARTMVEGAIAGDPRFVDMVLDRTEGKVTIPVANVTPVTLLIPEADDVP